MGDVRRSDFRQAVWLVAYASLTVSSIVLGDFSTALEMTEASPDNQTVRQSDFRLQTGDAVRTVSSTCGGSHDGGGFPSCARNNSSALPDNQMVRL